MNTHNHKVIGIVGGMGPQAGITLLNSILTNTSVVKDQDHFSTILMSFPSRIVDRTAFLNGSVTINPAFGIVEIIQKLETAGANVVGMACNTSHAPAILDVIMQELERCGSRVVFVNMPMETCRHMMKAYAGVRRIGLLTTNGTYRSGLYHKLLQEHGYEVIVPEFSFQDNIIHRMIYDEVFGLKARPVVMKQTRMLMKEALNFYKREHADAVVLGCTELSCMERSFSFNGLPLIDSTEALAKALVREATIAVNPCAVNADSYNHEMSR